MRGEHRALTCEQAHFDRRFTLEYIESGSSDSSGIECSCKGRLVDDGASRCVDQNRVPAHRIQSRGVDQVVSHCGQGAMNRDEVTPRQKLLE